MKLVINGKEVESSVKPQLMKGETMIPLKVVEESLNCDVNFEQETNTVYIDAKRHLEEKKAVVALTRVVTNGSADYGKRVESAISDIYEDEELIDIWLNCFEIEENKTPYIWGVDWCECPSEVEYIVKDLLEAKDYKVNDQTFVFEEDIEEMDTFEYLNILRERLIHQGLILASFDRGSDSYELVIFQEDQYPYIRNMCVKAGFAIDLHFH